MAEVIKYYLELITTGISMLSFFIAVIAAIIAYKQIMTSKAEARISNAKQIYKEYLLMAFNNPQFSSLGYYKNKEDYNKIKQDEKEFERYEYYISMLLFAAEEILMLTNYDNGWKVTISEQVGYHYLYFKDEDNGYYPEMYENSLAELVNDKIIEIFEIEKKLLSPRSGG